MSVYYDLAIAFTAKGYEQFQKIFTEEFYKKIISIELQENMKKKLIDNPEYKTADGSVLLYFKNMQKENSFFNKHFIPCIENSINELENEDFYLIKTGATFDGEPEIRGAFFDNPFELDLVSQIHVLIPKPNQELNPGM